MAKLKQVVDFLDSYLDIDGIDDKSWNGLQFQGKDDVRKIMLAVDAAVETFEAAAKMGADMVVVHHGNFWKYSNPCFKGVNKKRLDILYKAQISLYAAHLPLDRHKDVGNNAGLIRLLGGRIKEPFFMHNGKNVGFIGEFSKPKGIRALATLLEKGLDTKCKVLPFGNHDVKTIAVCSGGGGLHDFYESVDAGVDCFLTGDTSELYHSAKDAGISVIFAGHHATEIVGVRLLAAVLEKKLKVKCEFVDIKTGL